MVNIEPLLNLIGPYLFYFQNLWIQAGLALLAAIILSFIILIILERVIVRITKKTKTNVDDLIIEKAKRPFFWLLIFLGLRVSSDIAFDQIIVFKILGSISIILFVFIIARI